MKERIDNNQSEVSRRDFLKLMCGVAVIGFYDRLPKDVFGLSQTELNREQDSLLVENLVYLPERTEICTGQFTSDSSLVAMNFPLHHDNNYNIDKPITISKLPSGLNLSYKNLYYFRDLDCGDTNQEIVRATILPDTMGIYDLVTAVLDRGQFDISGKYNPILETYKKIDKNEDIFGQMTYWVGDGSIYPNKILNLLTAFGNILKYQENHGPLKTGEVYSYNKLIQLSSSEDYFLGYNSSHMSVRAGGVCAGATALANALYRMAEKTDVSFDRTYAGARYAHDAPYRLGPLAPPSYITDTTVFIDTKQTYDFRIVPPEDCYISPTFCLVPNEVETKDTAPDGLGVFDKNTGKYLNRSDVNLIMNVAFTKRLPKVSSSDLLQIRESYLNFRNSINTNKNDLDVKTMSSGCQLVGRFGWREKKPNNIIESIYPTVDLDTAPFAEEMKSSPYLQEISNLTKILNSVDQFTYPDMAEMIRNSDWYLKKKKNGLLTTMIESGINQLNHTKVKNQPVQCIQWVKVLASLNYPDSPLNIGARVRGPKWLIPEVLYKRRGRATAQCSIGGTIIADPDLKTREIKPGDLFLIKNSDVGHIGAFLATKDVDGKRLILATDANRENDGRVRIFTIEDRNLDMLLGAPPIKKVIVTKNVS